MTKLQQYKELALNPELNDSDKNLLIARSAIIDLLNRLEIAEKALRYYADHTNYPSYIGDDGRVDWESAKEALEEINK